MRGNLLLPGLLFLLMPVFAAKVKPPPMAPLTCGPWYERRTPEARPAAKPVVPEADGSLVLEAENFEDYGGWRLDTQFIHKMGSAYLIANGVGRPVAPAKTKLAIPESGVWRVWARTKDWLPEYSPGAFSVAVNGREGAVLGVSQRVGWQWEEVGEFELAKGETLVELRDRSGYFGRCDVIVFRKDGKKPADWRLRVPTPAVDRGEFDVVVVGAGPAGVPAAIAAAREGAKVVLIGDRPVLGGNASDEIGVNMCGAVVGHPAARETGICEEAICHKARFGGAGMSGAYEALCAAESNLTVVKCERMLSVEMKDGAIAAVRTRNTMNDGWSRFSGKLFVDATGDGWLGYFAGADYRFGRESRREFNEEDAPEHADELTMSGLLHEPSVGVGYRAEPAPEGCDYTIPEWAKVLPRGFRRKIPGLRGQWWLEHSGFYDDCADPERARDELIRISFAYWGWLREESPFREEARKYELREVPILTGRRESRRLMGDYILTANDCHAGRVFEDAVAYGGWSLDCHDPLGVSSPDSDGWVPRHPAVPVYTIPYRSLYSRNVPNLFMAGRCLSCSHVALGSARVQSTCSLMGQAVGTAAAMCIAGGESPRSLGKARIGELQRRLLRDDVYLPGFRSTDSSDLARGAKVTASSCVKETVRFSPNAKGSKAKRIDGDGPARSGLIVYGNVRPENVIDGVARPVEAESHAWVSEPGLPQWIRLDLAEAKEVSEVRLTFDSDLEFNAWLCRTAEELVKSYRLEGSSDGVEWFVLADETDNYQRHRIHRFPARRLGSLRLTVRETCGASEANVFEIRMYNH